MADRSQEGSNFKERRYQELLDAGFSHEWIDELTFEQPAPMTALKTRLRV
jgi:hypothetical protein